MVFREEVVELKILASEEKARKLVEEVKRLGGRVKEVGETLTGEVWLVLEISKRKRGEIDILLLDVKIVEEESKVIVNWKKVSLCAIFFLIMPQILWFKVIAPLLLDYWWFESVGYVEIFLINLKTKILIFILAFVADFGGWCIIWRIAHKRLKEWTEPKSWLWNSIAALISLLFAWATSEHLWFDWLKFQNQVPFGLSDPIFNNEVSFYVFTLPIINDILITILALTVIWIATLCIVVVGEGYLSAKEVFKDLKDLIHLLFCCFFVTLSVVFWFKQYSVLWSELGVVYGAGYTDVHVWIWVWRVLSVTTLISVVVTFFIKDVKLSDELLKFFLPLLVISGIFIAGAFASFAVQSFIVAPSELQREAVYIGYNINFTRYAYGLDEFQEIPYNPNAVLDEDVVNSPSIKNAKILDWRAVRLVLQQKQSLRLYYDMHDVDVDRYWIDGNETQVLITARELNVKGLPVQARTWVNKHLVYTHGYGIAINPVNKVDDEGMPILYVKDIPPVSLFPELEVRQPQIYYGELTNHYVIANTLQEEFDYPRGEENVYTHYDGSGGIRIDSTFKKFVIACNLDPINIWLSRYITDQSRLMIYRNIMERAQKIAPFLYYDSDPYIFIHNGELKWMINGIAFSDAFPYSEPGKLGKLRVNYVRDSVKVIIDAKNGTIEYFTVKEDPLIKTYKRIYPKLFKSALQANDYRKHFRYPVDLFTLQVQKFGDYHMRNIAVFYGKEDRWVIAKELFGETPIPMRCYNVILETDKGTQFVLMVPLTPANKENMIAWIGVMQDEDYGKFVVYEFPKEVLVYGPMQAESRISQNPEISEKMTLWGQRGSSVIRGNLLILPVRGSLLYIEPVYISSATSALPELKKVITVYHDPIRGDMVVWDDTLEKSVLKAVSWKAEVVPITVSGEKKVTVIAEIVIYDEEGKEVQRIPVLANQTIRIIPKR